MSASAMMEQGMARLFFDLDSSDVHYTDTEGTELADMAMVRNGVRDTQDRVVFSTMLTLQENWA